MKDEMPLHRENEELLKKLNNITDLFAQFVTQEVQLINEDVQRIKNGLQSGSMGDK